MFEHSVVKNSEQGQRHLVRGTIVAIESETLYGVSMEAGEGRRLVVADLLVTSQATLRLRLGDAVLCWLENDDHGRGVILGRIGPAETTAGEDDMASTTGPEEGSQAPDTLVIEAKQSLTLRVGEGSITIREDGRILIKGKDLVSHAQRMNRIKGGAVAIN